MTVAELIEAVDVLEQRGNSKEDVRAITDDSRQVRQGSVFVAVRGEQVNGHDFVRQAHRKGAVGIVMEDPIPADLAGESGAEAMPPCTFIQVPRSRVALGVMASRFFQDPSRRLQMIGITGTNGKTTVAHLCRALLQGGGKRTGLLGTVGYFIDDMPLPASHTTPGAVDLQALLAKMVGAGLDSAVMEVSSHALALDRVKGCEFDTVVFTNLTQDHLDFHGTLDAYFQAKHRLFTEYVGSGGALDSKRAIVNVDDAWAAKIIEGCPLPIWTYGLSPQADIRARDVTLSLSGTTCLVDTPMGEVKVESPLVGEHNVSNLLAAIGVGLQAGLSLVGIGEALKSTENVPGRFERIDEGQDFSVIVDYAHTDDALARLLAVARRLKTGNIMTVIGCGGDRDRGKRPKMGRVAAENSDQLYLTSDNPRSEDPVAILHDIERGVEALPASQRAAYQIIPDRREAIHAAIRAARPGDMVLIAGKGHEDYQLIGDQRLHFDDREVAREALKSEICRDVRQA